MKDTRTYQLSSYQMACKFVSMLYNQGEISEELYEHFCSTFLQKVKDSD